MVRIAINTLTSTTVTPEEEALGYFTRKKLKGLSTWDQWEAGEQKQLSQFARQKMFGDHVDPQLLPSNAVILGPHWNYAVKRSGVRRSRLCCNGSKSVAPQLHAVASTWSSCVALPIQRLFLALCAQQGLSIYGCDIIDAYAHTPAADTKSYLAVDQAYLDWYLKTEGKRINRC